MNKPIATILETILKFPTHKRSRACGYAQIDDKW